MKRKEAGGGRLKGKALSSGPSWNQAQFLGWMLMISTCLEASVRGQDGENFQVMTLKLDREAQRNLIGKTFTTMDTGAKIYSITQTSNEGSFNTGILFATDEHKREYVVKILGDSSPAKESIKDSNLNVDLLRLRARAQLKEEDYKYHEINNHRELSRLSKEQNEFVPEFISDHIILEDKPNVKFVSIVMAKAKGQSLADLISPTKLTGVDWQVARTKLEEMISWFSSKGFIDVDAHLGNIFYDPATDTMQRIDFGMGLFYTPGEGKDSQDNWEVVCDFWNTWNTAQQTRIDSVIVPDSLLEVDTPKEERIGCIDDAVRSLLYKDQAAKRGCAFRSRVDKLNDIGWMRQWRFLARYPTDADRYPTDAIDTVQFPYQDFMPAYYLLKKAVKSSTPEGEEEDSNLAPDLLKHIVQFASGNRMWELRQNWKNRCYSKCWTRKGYEHRISEMLCEFTELKGVPEAEWMKILDPRGLIDLHQEKESALDEYEFMCEQRYGTTTSGEEYVRTPWYYYDKEYSRRVEQWKYEWRDISRGQNGIADPLIGIKKRLVTPPQYDAGAVTQSAGNDSQNAATQKAGNDPKPSTTTSPNNSSKGLMIALIVLGVVAGVGALAVFYYFCRSESDNYSEEIDVV